MIYDGYLKRRRKKFGRGGKGCGFYCSFELDRVFLRFFESRYLRKRKFVRGLKVKWLIFFVKYNFFI